MAVCFGVGSAWVLGLVYLWFVNVINLRVFHIFLFQPINPLKTIVAMAE